MNKNRIVGLDLLKIIACLGVVGLHTIGKDSSEINRIYIIYVDMLFLAFLWCMDILF